MSSSTTKEKNYTIRFPEALFKNMKLRAQEMGWPFNALVVQTLSRWWDGKLVDLDQIENARKVYDSLFKVLGSAGSSAIEFRPELDPPFGSPKEGKKKTRPDAGRKGKSSDPHS